MCLMCIQRNLSFYDTFPSFVRMSLKNCKLCKYFCNEISFLQNYFYFLSMVSKLVLAKQMLPCVAVVKTIQLHLILNDQSFNVLKGINKSQHILVCRRTSKKSLKKLSKSINSAHFQTNKQSRIKKNSMGLLFPLNDFFDWNWLWNAIKPEQYPDLRDWF